MVLRDLHKVYNTAEIENSRYMTKVKDSLEIM